MGSKRAAQVARPPEAQLFRGIRPFWNNGNQEGFCEAARRGFAGDLKR